MSLLALAVAAHPDATPGALTDVAARALANRVDQRWTPNLRADILTHPATPDAAAHVAAAKRTWPPNLSRGLSRPHLTATGRARILATSHPRALATHLTNHADAHGDIHRALAAHIEHMIASDDPTPPVTIASFHLTLANHPTTPTPVHLAATTHLAALRPAKLDELTNGEPDILLAHATRHGTHLADLVATLACAGHQHLATRLHAYTHAPGAGANAHTAHVAALTGAATTTNTIEAWCKAITHSADPTIALAALRAHPGSEALLAHIATTPSLTGTAIHHYARTHARTDIGDLDDLDTTRTYTTTDFLLTTLPTHAHPPTTTAAGPGLALLHTLGQLPTRTDATTIATVTAFATTLAAYVPAGHIATSITPLALHPNTPRQGRDILLEVLCEALPEIGPLTAALATDDPTGALLNQSPLDVNRIHTDPTALDHLAHHLTPAITGLLASPGALSAALALEGGFAGTYRELLDTATTVAT